MKVRDTLKLLVIVCFLGLAIWVLDRHLVPSEERRERAKRVLDLDFDDARYLRVEHDALQAECIRDGNGWHIQWPLRGRADRSRVERVLAFLEALARSESVTSAQRRRRRLALDDYGLASPRARIVLRDRFNRRELLVGDDAPLGKLVYVMLKGEDAVIATSRVLLKALPKDVHALRDRTVVQGAPGRTARIAIHRPGGGFLQLVQVAGEWRLQQPIVGRADHARISAMLEALYALEVNTFVWDAPVGGESALSELPEDIEARFEPYGLARDEAAARVAVWVDQDEVGQELILGKPVAERPDEIYAKVKDIDSIFSVSKEILDAFSVTLNDIRDRVLFDLDPAEIRYAFFGRGDRELVLHRPENQGWLIKEPVQWKADAAKISEILEAFTSIRVERFVAKEEAAALGLDPPAFSVRLSTRIPPDTPGGESGTAAAADDGVLGVRVGHSREGTNVVYATFEGDPSVMAIRPGFLGSASFSLTDPYGFRDRTVLSLAAARVDRLALVRGKSTQAVFRNAQGVWEATKPEGAEPVVEAIRGSLLLAADVQALRVEPLDLKRQEAYGLAKPTAVLTFGLAEGGGIQKSLVIGKQNAGGEWYSLLQGQDAVFVLPDAAARRLMADIVRRRAATEQ